MVMAGFLLDMGGVLSTQAEEGQDRHDHDDQPDEINQAVPSLPPAVRGTFGAVNRTQNSPEV
jgi:hypothetical protein